jgi:GNAT superfamily N-acetyltransferase
MKTATTHAPGSAENRVCLGDHRWVSIRPIERSDAAGLSAFYSRLSPESRRRRFLGPVAFAVADDLHGLGLGRALVDAAIRLAGERGLTRVSASLYSDNTPMRHLLRDPAREVVRDVIEDGVEEIELRLAA